MEEPEDHIEDDISVLNAEERGTEDDSLELKHEVTNHGRADREKEGHGVVCEKERRETKKEKV